MLLNSYQKINTGLMRAIADDAADYGYNDLEYEYNADGLLVGKTELEYPYYHQYYYDGGRMIAEVWESEGLFFLYDSTGVIGMQYWYDEELMGTYWFSKNMQGDIVAMYGDDGTLYETYTYDAWGNKTTTRHSSGYAISCPFGYRSYYYDSDLGMYYLQTRYYDPAMGRFISADTFISQESSSTQGYNLYSYCFNNPITFTDSSGQWAQWFKDAVKWAAENWIKPAVDAIQNALSQTSFTYSSGITLSGSPGIFTGSLQCGFTFDSDGNIAIQTSYGGGITSGASPGVSVSSYQSISNAPNYQYLEGAGYHIGGSYGTNIGYIPVTFGGDFDIMPTTDNDYYGITSNFGIGGSPGVEVHATWGGTQTITSINLFDIFNCCYEKIMGW